VVICDKRGYLSEKVPALLSKLGFEVSIWNELALNFGKDFHGAVGSCSELDLFAKHTGKAWIAEKRKLAQIF